ncbi:MAG: Gfo/Idh/MocA family oxidoreductase [Tepidisphaeraceae bacterium]
MTRRELLRQGSSMAAALAAASVAGAQVTPPATTPPATTPPEAKPVESKPATTTAATMRANDKPNLADIGCGGIAIWHAQYVGKYSNIVALCDVDQGRLATYNEKFAAGKAFVTADYRKVLERKDVDVVLVATPDHWHTKITADALRAGKDVYCEKPLTLTIEEGRFLCRVVRQTAGILQVGTQQRSEDRFTQVVALARSGRLGTIRHVTVVIGPTPVGVGFASSELPSQLDWNTWLGQAPNVSYIKQRCHDTFRWWYEYSGGRMTDWGAHHVDIAQAAVAPDLPGPTTIAPARVKFQAPYKDGYPLDPLSFNTASEFEVTCTYANGVEMLIADRVDRFPDTNGIMILGDAGSVFVNREKQFGAALDALKTDPLPPGAFTPTPNVTPIPHEAHFVNFLECCRTRKQPTSDVFEHVRTLNTCHLANIAMRLGRTIQWDATAQRIVGDDEADAFQSRPQRKGFEVV